MAAAAGSPYVFGALGVIALVMSIGWFLVWYGEEEEEEEEEEGGGRQEETPLLQDPSSSDSSTDSSTDSFTDSDFVVVNVADVKDFKGD